MPEPADIARGVIDANRFMVLGTAAPDGGPRVSPVYYDHAEYRRFYWVSSPDARHSRNIADRPRVELVIFNSQVVPRETSAVYLGAHATEVRPDELAPACAEAFARVREGARAFTPDELSGPADLRLYRADVDHAAIHVRGGDPVRGKGVDTRLPVELGGTSGPAAPRSLAQRRADTLRRLSHDVDAWIATAGVAGPHLVPLSYLWDGETLLVSTPATSPTGRNLLASSTARVGIGPTRDVVLIHGTVSPVETLEDGLGDRFATATGFDPRESAGYRYFRIRPERVQAWREVDELPGRDLMRDGRWLT